ncbi:hypothetical protein J7E96_09710 [Streptomyces sp. ISL-96]|uniref:hypothetical protein n=1 Tax=Streptomyces sp. ISL-96 TaxID=2819191 RepID=UPI001BEA55D6|nr:hypothetical protein [Streptomyces sp. ISL-96]MBT2488793.1 hypothetical protein [Streptomyces sp. ISL-96]
MSLVPNALTAIKAAERRKLPVPADVLEAAAVRGAIFETVQRPAPERPPLPGTAAEVEEVIREHAAQLNLLDLTQRAASRFQEEADLRFVRLTAAAVPGWIEGLQKEFTTLVGVVRKAADKLPADTMLVDSARLDWNNSVHATAYNKAEGAVAQLEQLISDRADMVKVAGGDGGRDNALFAVAGLPAPTVDRVMSGDWRQLSESIAQWRDLRHKPVARWVYLVRQDELTLTLATPGEVRQRSIQVERWRNAGHASRSGMNAAGGQAAAQQYLAETA